MRLTPAQLTADGSNLTPLLDSNGDVVTSSVDADGFFAEAFKDSHGNIIVAFEGDVLPGTAAASAAGSAYVNGALGADAQLAAGKIPTSLSSDVASFMNRVESAATFNHISTSNIFLTGYSLGGAEAEAAGAANAALKIESNFDFPDGTYSDRIEDAVPTSTPGEFVSLRNVSKRNDVILDFIHVK